MSEPIYRLATIADLPQLVELRVGMQSELHVEGTPQAGPEYRSAVGRYLIENMDRGTYVSTVAEVDGKLISANGLVIYTKPPSIGGGFGRQGYVSNVYTRPEWRGRGIASALIRVLVEYAQKNGIERLHLGATELGKGVYERAGFTAPRYVALEMRLSQD